MQKPVKKDVASKMNASAYIGELVGTFFLVFFITAVGVLYISVGDSAQFGSDYAVIGLTYAFILTALIIGIGVASGGHFNPAITFGAALMKKISPIDALIYILVQLSGGIMGVLLTKTLLLDEGRIANYGAVSISPLLGGSMQGFLVESIGTFLLVLTVLVVSLGIKAKKEWAPLAIGIVFGAIAMVAGPLTGASVNPARWLGPALVSGDFTDWWVYILAPLVGSALAYLFYRFVIEKSAKPDTSVSPGTQE